MTLRVEIKIVDEMGTVLFSHEDDALKPTSKKLNPDFPLVHGDYKFFGVVYQPLVMLASKAGGY